MNHPTKLLVAMGTRPEIIKLAPIIHRADERDDFSVDVCHTGQHLDLAETVLDYFQIQPDFTFELMLTRPSLAQITAQCLIRFETLIAEHRYDAIIAQGDTATCASAALIGFFTKTPVVHVEAGLRTGNMQSPWPEEFNRRVAGLAASLHCAATPIAVENLVREGVSRDAIIQTGNTVIDALQWALSKEEARGEVPSSSPPVVLLTAHRRENFGEPLRRICNAVLRLARHHADHRFVFVTHPNPNAGAVVRELLGGRSNIQVHEPMSYDEFVRTASQSRLLISDSGGVQEEAPTLGVPLLITRESTERPEAVQCGAARLVGTSEQTIFEHANELLSDPSAHAKMTGIRNPFGDGNASEKILNSIQSMLHFESIPIPKNARLKRTSTI
jgi:UDP-N-acetylglucosamine 2-epimerase (non-hydrolysing)